MIEAVDAGLGALAVSLRTDEVRDPRLGDLAADVVVVVTPVEMERLDIDEQTPGADSSKVAGIIIESLRFAPSITQPTGMPNESVAIDHFQPSFPRSAGFFPVPSPPHGALCCEPSIATSAEIEPDMRS